MGPGCAAWSHRMRGTAQCDQDQAAVKGHAAAAAAGQVKFLLFAC